MTNPKPRECDVALETPEYLAWKDSGNANRMTCPLNIKTYEKVRMIEKSYAQALEQRLAEREAELADARKENYADDMNQAVETKLKYRERVKELEAEVEEVKTRERQVTQVLEAALRGVLRNINLNVIDDPNEVTMECYHYKSSIEQALAEVAKVREGSK